MRMCFILSFQKSVERFQRYRDLTVFKMAAAAMLDLLSAYLDPPHEEYLVKFYKVLQG